MPNDVNAGLLPMTELARCPFCGGEPLYYDREAFKAQRVECLGCSTLGPASDHEQAAILAWNSRATPPMPAGVTEGVETEPLPQTTEAGVRQALDRWLASPKEERSEHPPSVMYFNAGWEAGYEEAHRLAHATPPPEAEGWRAGDDAILAAVIAQALNPALFSSDEIAAHRAASPATVANAKIGMCNFTLPAAIAVLERYGPLAAAPLPASPVGDDE